MTQVPDYSGLEPQWQADCHSWNSSITTTNHRQPALSNPSMFLRLFNDGYDTYENLKAELDEATRLAGWLTVSYSSKSTRKMLACSRGAQRPSASTTHNTTTIKADCPWRATAHMTRATAGKWKLVIQEGKHAHHGPQAVAGAERGWTKLTAEQHEFLSRTARDPSMAKPKKLELALRREYPTIELGPNIMKNWLAEWRKEKQGIYTSAQATLDWLQKEDCWYTWSQDEKRNITGIFWCEKRQIAWIREQRFTQCLSLDCTYSTNNKKMPYFQGTAVTHTKKNLPLFQGVIDNEREPGFRWLLEQVNLLLADCEAGDPTVIITDYDTALINALEYAFPSVRHQLCVFHMNMNLVLNIKKKWRKATIPIRAEIEEEEEGSEEEDPELASLNAPARNKAIIPLKVPDNIPHTRQALFDLLKFMEYSNDRDIYEIAWQRLQEKFSDQKEIIDYLRTYYVDEEERIVAKWAAHQTCKILNFGLRTTSSTESTHRKLKVYLGHGMGNIFYLVEAAHETLEDTARGLRLEEARQKTSSLRKFNGQKWLGQLPLQVSWSALDLLSKTRKHAMRMLKKQVPRGNCSPSTCACPIFTQFGLICASRIADKEEAGDPLTKADVHKVFWLDRDLLVDNPLLAVLSPERVRATKGRPRETATFATDEAGILESSGGRATAVISKRTTSTTTGLGSKAGDKIRATTASLQRVNSAWEWNDETLQSLDQKDTRSSSAQREAVQEDQRLAGRLTRQANHQPRRRSAPSSVSSSAPPMAKKQRTGVQRTINQLLHVDLTADDVASEVGDGEGTQSQIEVLGGG
ncbi:hypothetical protein FJTKL_07167 [Diaporthe vaccinii]|uniref:MULE transposase domain-containing protein n=1 Tax=Diaporthe vaccinii TaxID=105482 RepID=A0ABR4DPI0_9PEZI